MPTRWPTGWQRQPKLVTSAHWQVIDAFRRAAGEYTGVPGQVGPAWPSCCGLGSADQRPNNTHRLRSRPGQWTSPPRRASRNGSGRAAEIHTKRGGRDRPHGGGCGTATGADRLGHGSLDLVPLRVRGI